MSGLGTTDSRISRSLRMSQVPAFPQTGLSSMQQTGILVQPGFPTDNLQ